MTYQTIDEMRCTDPRTVSRDSLVDRSSIRLDPQASHEERLRDYIRQIRNPYCYLDGKFVVKLSFQARGPSIEDRVKSVYLAGA